MSSSLPRWSAGTITVLLLAGTIGAAQLLPPFGDFRPFVMTIEAWNSARVMNADGGTLPGTSTYWLEYRRYDTWKMTLIDDDISRDQIGEAWECDRGMFMTLDPRGRMTTWSNDSGNCNGVARWIHYGIAQWCPWQRTVENGRAICTDGAERVVVDLATGLPVLYEAGLSRGSVGERTTFRVEHYGG